MRGIVSEGRRQLFALAGAATVVRFGLGGEWAWSFPAAGCLNQEARHKSRGGTATSEAKAIAHLREEESDDAIAVLEIAVEREIAKASPSLRLLDLLATLYGRAGRVKDLSDLAGRIEAATTKYSGRATAALLERASKWRDENSKWRRKRANTQITIKWRWTRHEAQGVRKFVRRDDIVIPV